MEHAAIGFRTGIFGQKQPSDTPGVVIHQRGCPNIGAVFEAKTPDVKSGSDSLISVSHLFISI